jgi:hypothetical protein
MRRILATSLLSVMMSATIAHAADESTVPSLVAGAATAASAIAQRTDVAAAPSFAPRSIAVRRPSALPSLYVGSALLQGYDAYSTLTVLRSGGAEANPMMQGLTQNPAAFIAVKAGITAASIIAAEKMWKDHNRTGAVLTMVVSNALMGFVAANNSHVLSQVR